MKTPSMVMLEEEIRLLQRELNTKKADLRDLQWKAIRVTQGSDISDLTIPVESDNWDCEVSPIGYCVYDEAEDSALDECLYCGHPNERK